MEDVGKWKRARASGSVPGKDSMVADAVEAAAAAARAAAAAHSQANASVSVMVR